jgi:hypothetical protein
MIGRRRAPQVGRINRPAAASPPFVPSISRIHFPPRRFVWTLYLCASFNYTFVPRDIPAHLPQTRHHPAGVGTPTHPCHDEMTISRVS